MTRRIVHHAHAALVPGAPGAVLAQLAIERGGTRFPWRPIVSRRFLIGSGTNCHLQLGGDIPLLHSLLTRVADGWSIEAIAAEPPLMVNGVVCRHCRLHPEDRVEVGPFRFRLRTSDPATACEQSGQEARRDCR